MNFESPISWSVGTTINEMKWMNEWHDCIETKLFSDFFNDDN